MPARKPGTALPPRTPGCIRFEIGKCLGPCIAAVTENAYRERVTQAHLSSYVHGISSLEATAAAIAAGFEFIGSEAISPALDEPDQPVAMEETAHMLRILMAGRPRT